MKNSTNAEERYFLFLKTLAARKRGFKNFSKVLSKNKIGAGLGTILRKDGLVERDDKGISRWTGGKPTLEMCAVYVNRVNDIIKKYAKSGSKKEKTIKSWNKINHGHQSRTTSPDILDLSKLRRERMQIMDRVKKIDSVLEVAAGI